MSKVQIITRSETFGIRRTVGLFSDLFITLPIFFPFVHPFGNKERTFVLCCIDGSDVSGNTFLV